MNSEHLAARLRARELAVDLRIVANTGHIGLVNGFYSPRFSPVLEETLAWIGRAPASADAYVPGTISAD